MRTECQRREGDFEYTPKTGTEFINMIRKRYLWVLGDQAVEDLQLFKKKTKEDDPTELLYMVMNRAENGQCVIDNTKTCTSIQNQWNTHSCPSASNWPRR